MSQETMKQRADKFHDVSVGRDDVLWRDELVTFARAECERQRQRCAEALPNGTLGNLYRPIKACVLAAPLDDAPLSPFGQAANGKQCECWEPTTGGWKPVKPVHMGHTMSKEWILAMLYCDQCGAPRRGQP